MKEKTLLPVMLLGLSLLLITSCNGPVSTRPANTPDPFIMTLEERAIWDFENFYNELHDLAKEAADTPVEDLGPISSQSYLLSEEIKEYEVPLFAVKAQSALYNYANAIYKCCSRKYQKYKSEMVGDETLGEVDYSICDRIQDFAEPAYLYIQELKEVNTEK